MPTRLWMLVAAASLGFSAMAEPTAKAADPGASSLPEITVLAQRLQLAPRVLNFVNGITDLRNNEALARWNSPVCPLVTGLPREQGEFILARVSEIARSAGVPLGDEHCAPNLFIFLTPQPKELLQVMDRQKHFVTFGGAPPLQIAEFIDTPRRVRVWYDSNWSSPGLRPGPGLPPGVQIQGGYTQGGAPMVSAPEGGSRLTSAVIYSLSFVYVIVDQTQLSGVSVGQLADYVGMVGLAQIKPAPQTGDTQSILKLFAGAPESAPPGMGDWDRLFLKSLYGTEQASKLQRSLITRSMVRELVP